MINKYFLKYKELILYVFFGGLTTAVNFVTYIAVTAVYKSDSTFVPTTIAWIISVAFAYFTNRRWVFCSKVSGFVPLLREFTAFVGARIFSGGLDIAVMYIAVDTLGFNDKIIKLASNVLVIVINYILSKLLIFRKKK